MRLLIGVDPAQRANGWAYRIDQGPVTTGKFTGIENLLNIELPEPLDGLEVFVCIECPSWSGVGTRETRSAATAWERILQKRYPNRHIWFVDPRQWQSLICAGAPGETAKDRAMWTCVNILGVAVESDHEADAVCLMQFAWLKAQGMVDVSDERGNAAKLRRERDKRRRAG